MKSITCALSAALTVTMMVTPAQADPGDWSSDHFEVLALADSCMMFGTYELDGRSNVMFRMAMRPEQTTLLLSSADWSSVDGAEYTDFDFHFLDPDKSFGDGITKGLRVPPLEHGFIANLADEAVDALAASRRLVVTRGEEPDRIIVTDISLTGSGAAVAALRHCVRTVEAANAARERRENRFNHIARDPFAASGGEPPAPGAPNWARIPAAEFPERAQSRGITSGDVVLSCLAQPNGSPSDCNVVSENPAGAGFAQAAQTGVRRARFAPGTTGRQTFTVRFRLAPEPTPTP